MRMLCGCGCGVGGSYSSNSAPSLGTSICCECNPKKQNKQKKTKKKVPEVLLDQEALQVEASDLSWLRIA